MSDFLENFRWKKEEIELLEKIPEYKDSKELKTREVASIFMLQIHGGNHK